MLKWFWRSWPALILILLLCIHLLLIYYFCLNAASTNKTISLFSQLVGGVLILYSIDSNIGVFKEINIFTVFKNYLREFPLIKRSVVLIAGAGSMISFGRGKITATRNPKSIEDKIKYLQEQIDTVKLDLEHVSRELHEKIENISKESGVQRDGIKTAQRNIETKIEAASIGGIRVQLFGVFLMVYGAISGYVA